MIDRRAYPNGYAVLVYFSDDQDRVRELVERMRADGVAVLWDRDVPPGGEWKQFMQTSICEATRVVLCLSKARHTRTRSELFREWEWIDQEKSARPPEHRFRIAVYLEQCAPDPNLHGCRCISLFGRDEEREYGYLVEDLPKAAVSHDISDETADALRASGIIRAWRKLLVSPAAPARFIPQVRTELKFLGISGGKWLYEFQDNGLGRKPVLKPDVVEKFSDLAAMGCNIHLLLLNPTAKAAEVVYKGDLNRPPSVWPGWFDILRQLQAGNRRVTIRLYSQLPCFRLVLLDKTHGYLSHYRLDNKGRTETENGLKLPVIEFLRAADMPLYLAFERHFDELWEEATPLKVD